MNKTTPQTNKEKKKRKGEKMLALSTWWALRKLAAVIIKID